jgi:hypothetical protein
LNGIEVALCSGKGCSVERHKKCAKCMFHTAASGEMGVRDSSGRAMESRELEDEEVEAS